jgi:hypothetical protein
MIFLNSSTTYQNTRCQKTKKQNMTREQFFFLDFSNEFSTRFPGLKWISVSPHTLNAISLLFSHHQV